MPDQTDIRDAIEATKAEFAERIAALTSMADDTVAAGKKKVVAGKKSAKQSKRKLKKQAAKASRKARQVRPDPGAAIKKVKASRSKKSHKKLGTLALTLGVIGAAVLGKRKLK
jgi:TATA-box binding protein (TBP) (component of TFIID and TFIIIB)